MKKFLLLGLLAVVVGVIGITAVLASENALLVHPKGIISSSILELIIINISLMLVIIVPTYILLFTVVWKYCIKKDDAKYDPEHSFGLMGEVLMWGLPTLVVAVMSIVTWKATHALNPYKPIESDKKPLTIQIVALNWKWLFIYPEEGIGTLNYFHIPAKRPIHLKLAADNSPMNSFWIPELSGQIYAMTGMTTQLHMMADGPGDYVGRAVENNGEGYAGMTFTAKSSSEKDFDAWVAQVKRSRHHLTEDAYNELMKPSVNSSVIFYSKVKDGLYHKIVHKYMYPTKPVL